MARLVTWALYRDSIGDRSELFAAVVDTWPIDRALYPGSYVDLSPSTAIPNVIYADTNARAARYFAEPERVRAELAGRTRLGAAIQVRFLASDYTRPLEVADASVDLVISLFAGPMSRLERWLPGTARVLWWRSRGERAGSFSMARP